MGMRGSVLLLAVRMLTNVGGGGGVGGGEGGTTASGQRVGGSGAPARV